jgi:predicted DsbA family dithiol-disulfide isomerase
MTKADIIIFIEIAENMGLDETEAKVAVDIFCNKTTTT